MKRTTIPFLLALLCCHAGAQEVYKWTDKDGKVHFGDRKAAPTEARKAEVKVQPPSVTPASPASANAAAEPDKPRAPGRSGGDTASVPVAPYRVGGLCQGLATQIQQVKPGQNWEVLARQFNETCPGITYECVNYKREPEKNKCTWVERTGSSMVNTKNYE